MRELEPGLDHEVTSDTDESDGDERKSDVLDDAPLNLLVAAVIPALDDQTDDVHHVHADHHPAFPAAQEVVAVAVRFAEVERTDEERHDQQIHDTVALDHAVVHGQATGRE